MMQRKFMKNRKGSIEIQFNWIYVLIAGALILLFFGGIVAKQKTQAEIKICNSVLDSYSALITGGIQSPGVFSSPIIPDLPMTFTCESYSCKGGERNLKNNIVFAPSNIHSFQLNTWALSYDAPFYTTNFLYLSTPNTIFYIEDDALRGELPQNITKRELSDIAGNLHFKDDYIVIVYNSAFESNHAKAFEDMPDENVRAILIKNNNSIEFKQKNGQTWGTKQTSYYATNETAYGAIFSPYETYSCIIKGAFERQSIVAQLYQSKADALEKTAQGNREIGAACESRYRTANETLGLLKSNAETCKTPKEACISSIVSNIHSLENTHDLIRTGSCPLIY